MLQERMKQEDESSPKSGNVRWKSARADKGTVRSYAKDVQEKIKRRSAESDNSSSKATSKGRRIARAEAESGNFKSKSKILSNTINISTSNNNIFSY